MAFQHGPDRKAVRRTRLQLGTAALTFALLWVLYVIPRYSHPKQAAPRAAQEQHSKAWRSVAQHGLAADGALDGVEIQPDSSGHAAGLERARRPQPGSQASADSAEVSQDSKNSFQQDTTEALCEPHDKCVFVASTGRSGSTNLQDALNQIPGVFVRGENNGLFQIVHRLSSMVGKVMREVEADFALEGIRPRVAADAKEEYEQYVAARLKTAWVNSWPKGSAQCTASLVFKQLFGTGVFRDYIVGFKEVRYNSRSGINSYGDLERHLDFLLGLCKDSRIVLNMRRDVKATAHSGHFQGKMSKEWEGLLEQEVGWFQQYAAARPARTMVMYYEDMFDAAKNQTLAEDLMQFIGVEKTEINFGRQKGWWAYPKKRG